MGSRERDMSRKRKLRRRRRRSFLVFIVIIIICFLKTSFNYSQKNVWNIVQAEDLSGEILSISEKLVTNVAFQEKKQAIDNEKTKKIHEEKKKEIKKQKIREKNNIKVAYLTFDDGPSTNITPQVLDILDEYDVKATFFVIGQLAESYPDILKRIDREGHAIGNHSYSHNYSHIYKDIDNFMKEIHLTEKAFKNILGEDYENNLIRFPGGSFGPNKAPFREKVTAAGYNFYDWNSLNGDAEGRSISKNRLVERFKETSNGKEELVILMHDMGGKQTTVDALPQIIEYLQGNGYEFDILK